MLSVSRSLLRAAVRPTPKGARFLSADMGPYTEFR